MNEDGLVMGGWIFPCSSRVPMNAFAQIFTGNPCKLIGGIFRAATINAQFAAREMVAGFAPREPDDRRPRGVYHDQPRAGTTATASNIRSPTLSKRTLPSSGKLCRGTAAAALGRVPHGIELCAADPTNISVHRTGFSSDRANISVHRTGFSSDRAHASVHRAGFSSHRAHISVYRTGLSPDRAHGSVHRTGFSTDRANCSVHRTGFSSDRANFSTHGPAFAALQALLADNVPDFAVHGGADRENRRILGGVYANRREVVGLFAN
ncbi:hypothetical protein ACQE3E_07190 [Methylomonas sp. MED-D]|uniref:hypothetical protein n=1 Tax=unclassified Methylomonas TaxID=2608980 RepID=UPI0028A50E0B|nr:hypothetical protein [Methylomonas sp. MV1]MDT4329305.1 hypothetical protein [Methylomonas sp. MV1]